MTETKEIIELYQVAEIYQTSLQEVHNLVKDLNRKVSNLVECINPLRFCKEINQNELEKQLSDIYQISQSIQDSLKEIAESTDFETKDWQDEEGLHSYIDELELHLKERKLSLNRRQRLHSLAEELERYTIKHRSKQQKSDLVDLRDAAARDLRKIFLQKKAPYLPGPEDINNWLNWALNLENDSLEEVQSELAKINKELSQFICTCELSWLIKNKEEIDKEKISIEEVSKEELSQKEPLIEEPSEEEASIAEPSKEESLKEEVLKKDKEKPPEWDSVDFTGLVQILIQKDKKASCIELQMLVVKLLERRELALAYHLARLSEELGTQIGNRFPSWAIQALIVGRNFPLGNHELVDSLQQILANYQDNIFDMDSEWKHGIRLLIAAATFRPALLAPTTGAPSILHNIHLGETPELCALAKSIARFGNVGVPLPRSALKKAWTIAEWQREMEELISRTRDWLVQAKNFTIISKPAREVWKNWISKDGPIYVMIDPVIQNDVNRIHSVKKQLNKWPDNIEKDARYTHRKELNYHGDILRPALNQISRRAFEAINMAEDWVTLVGEKPDPKGSFNETQVVDLRRSFKTHYEGAIMEIDESISSVTSPPQRVGALLCRDSLTSLHSLFDQTHEQISVSKRASELFNADLLRIPGITLDSDWEVEGKSPKQLDIILNQLSSGLPGLSDAFKMQCQKENHEATGQIIELLRQENDALTIIEEMEKKRETSIKKGREALQRGIEVSQRKLSDGLNKGLLGDGEYESWSASLVSFEQKIRTSESDFLRFFDVRRYFEEIDSTLRKRRDSEVTQISKRLADLSITGEEKERVQSVLSQGDIYTANDYIERLMTGKELPETIEMQANIAFLDLFKPSRGVSRFSKIEGVLSDIAPRRLVEYIKEGEGVSGVDMRVVPGTQARQSANMLETWMQTKRIRKITEVSARAILQGLGINPIDMRITTTGQRIWIELKAETITDCPVSEYGSKVDGSFKILCEWGISNEEDLLAAFADALMELGVLFFILAV